MKDLKAVCEQVAASHGYSQLKPQQLEAMLEFITGKGVFVVLPIGFGKKLNIIITICKLATCI